MKNLFWANEIEFESSIPGNMLDNVSLDIRVVETDERVIENQTISRHRFHGTRRVSYKICNFSAYMLHILIENVSPLDSIEYLHM